MGDKWEVSCNKPSNPLVKITKKFDTRGDAEFFYRFAFNWQLKPTKPKRVPGSKRRK